MTSLMEAGDPEGIRTPDRLPASAPRDVENRSLLIANSGGSDPAIQSPDLRHAVFLGCLLAGLSDGEWHNPTDIAAKYGIPPTLLHPLLYSITDERFHRHVEYIYVRDPRQRRPVRLYRLVEEAPA